MRALFRCQEQLRFENPDRAFQYTAVDGGKAMVAPVKRINGKLAAKAREHSMLEFDRPAHVTILCLVRDAAARLPGGVGTRADVCTLLKDSQYFVQETPEAQLNQVVSGAMDRLHYEKDPCVRFIPDKKLWVYLHRDRREEDFDADGTVSTRNWGKRRTGRAPAGEEAEARDSGSPEERSGGSVPAPEMVNAPALQAGTYFMDDREEEDDGVLESGGLDRDLNVPSWQGSSEPPVTEVRGYGREEGPWMDRDWLAAETDGVV